MPLRSPAPVALLLLVTLPGSAVRAEDAAPRAPESEARAVQARAGAGARSGSDAWSLRPVHRPDPPLVQDASWCRNPLDRFVLVGLESRGLRPSSEADRRTLIRRLSVDLIGLPPSADEVARFVADSDAAAYEKLVERLLGSPHYGERWARHWLDVVRFGESDGFERNATRPNAWPYRDWVIRAFNADMPYGEFCRWQIAGDVLRPGDPDAARATGFLIAGVHNAVLGNDMMRAVARQDELEDLVAAVGQTFLGLTVNCARCHDHKFDPITQRDYYRLASALSGVEHGERDLRIPAIQADLARLEPEIATLKRELAAIEDPVRRSLLAERHGADVPVAPATPLAAWDFRAGPHDQLGSLDVEPLGDVRFSEAGAVLDGKTAWLRSAPLARELTEKTLEAWVRLDNLTQSGGGVMTVATRDGARFDAIVFAEKEPGRWMAGSDSFNRYQPFDGPSEDQAREHPVHVAITYQADGTITGYRNGRPYGRSYRSSAAASFQAQETVVAFGCRHEPAGGNKMLAGVLVKARLYDRALSEDDVRVSAELGDYVTEQDLVARLAPELRARRAGLRDRLADRSAEYARLRARAAVKTYAALSRQPELTRLLARGRVTEPGEVVPPGGIPAVSGPPADFGLTADAPEAERRRKLADWITDPRNPLFGRVIVNRLWHYHFGTGIVETPNDLGSNGGQPSHPELLDWLAAELAAQGQSLKALHRLIVTSSSYRQASQPRPEPLAVDGDSRLVWRKKPLRIEGEVLRDAMLAVAGLLNPELGGRGFSDYREYFNNGTTYFDPIDPAGPAFDRRSVYRFLPRGGNQGLLDAFDCPDPSSAAPRRFVTTTPLQALALLNGSFTLRMADAFAARLESEVPGGETATMDARIERAWQIAFQRDPEPAERALARQLVTQHGLRALCRGLFNANEFLTAE